MEQQHRVEFLRNAKGAVKQGVSPDHRKAAREQKADEWTHWFHHRIDLRGGTPVEHLPDALGELEERVADQVAGAVRELKATLMKALK